MNIPPLSAAFVGFALLQQANHLPITAVSICKFDTHVVKWESRVAISANIIDGYHHLLLVHESCPHKVIELSISNKIFNTLNLRPLWIAINRTGYIGTIGKQISATAVGRYQRKQGWPEGVLELDEIRDLKVKLKSNQPENSNK